ncbi:MAG: hypothetical protein ACREPJ_01600 [Rhodanobacteraceae bacterium]
MQICILNGDDFARSVWYTLQFISYYYPADDSYRFASAYAL